MMNHILLINIHLQASCGRASPLLEEAKRIPPKILLRSLLGPFFAIFCIFSHFFRIFFASYIIMHFFIDFFRFFIDFGRILGGFWDDFSMIFHIFLKNVDFVKYSVFPRKNHYFSYVELLEIHEKSVKNQ